MTKGNEADGASDERGEKKFMMARYHLGYPRSASTRYICRRHQIHWSLMYREEHYCQHWKLYLSKVIIFLSRFLVFVSLFLKIEKRHTYMYKY